MMMALALVGFGTVAWISTRPAPLPAKAAPALEKVLVAAHNLRAGSLLQPGDITAAARPLGQVLADAPLDKPAVRNGLIGAMVRYSLPAGALLLPDDVIRPGDHGFLAAVLGSGMRAVSIGVDAVSGTAGLIWPGDRVDLILTQTLTGQNTPSGHQIVGEIVLSNVRVIAIDQKLVEGGVPSDPGGHLAQTVTLEVTPRQAERVVVATRLGQLSLAVHSAKPGSLALTAAQRPVTMWGSDVSPALDSAPSKRGGAAVTVYQGQDKGQEFKF